MDAVSESKTYRYSPSKGLQDAREYIAYEEILKEVFK
jgi:hypothetical protein